jgi:hypothetical protein
VFFVQNFYFRRKIPKDYDPISKELQAKIDAWIADKKKFLATYLEKK